MRLPIHSAQRQHPGLRGAKRACGQGDGRREAAVRGAVGDFGKSLEVLGALLYNQQFPPMDGWERRNRAMEGEFAAFASLPDNLPAERLELLNSVQRNPPHHAPPPTVPRPPARKPLFAPRSPPPTATKKEQPHPSAAALRNL